MLEAARILGNEKYVCNIRFISFTLEELNPTRELRTRKIAQSLGLTDEHNRYTTLRTQKVMKQLLKLQTEGQKMGKSIAKALADARSQLETQMSESEVKYAREIEEMFMGITNTSWHGKTALVGSGFWVEEALQVRKRCWVSYVWIL